jgi:CRP-like cAMP-binding protein
LTDIGAPAEEARIAIASSSLFEDLQDGVIGAVAEAAIARRYAAGETVLSIGQFDGSEFLLVAEGRLKAAHSDPATGAMIVDYAGPGDFVGLAAAVVGGEPGRLATTTISSEEDAIVIAIDAEAFRATVAQRPTLTRNLMLHFARRAGGEARAGAEEGSPERRIFAALIAYVERDAVDALWRIPRMPKHRELADRANVEEQDAANAVAKLIQSGVARRDYPGLVIEDMARLNKLAS